MGWGLREQGKGQGGSFTFDNGLLELSLSPAGYEPLSWTERQIEPKDLIGQAVLQVLAV